MTERAETGKQGEDIALAYLKKRGYHPLERNYRHGHHEIDLIMRDGIYLVFVEVKTRASVQYGSPAEFVTAKKRRNLILAAEAYMQEKHCTDAFGRFDVVEVFTADGTVNHIRDAFGV